MFIHLLDCIQKNAGSGVRTYEKGKFLGTWRNKAKCCRDLGIPQCGNKIHNCLLKRSKTAQGLIFEYEEL